MIVVAFIGFSLLKSGGGSSGGYMGVTGLSIREYLENSNALGSNVYQIEGTINERLDNWPSSSGRLFSVMVEDGDNVEPLPVLLGFHGYASLLVVHSLRYPTVFPRCFSVFLLCFFRGLCSLGALGGHLRARYGPPGQHDQHDDRQRHQQYRDEL